MVALPGQAAMVHLDVVVVVPRLAGAVPYLHKPHAALNQAPRDEQLPSLRPLAVQLADVFRFTIHVERIGRVHLHPVRQLERLDARLELRVLLSPGRMPAIESLDEIELPPLLGEGESAILDVLDQFFDRRVARVDVRALVNAGEKTGLPVLRLLNRVAAWTHGDEAGQVQLRQELATYKARGETFPFGFTERRLFPPPILSDADSYDMSITVDGDDSISITDSGGIVESYAVALDNKLNPENQPEE